MMVCVRHNLLMMIITCLTFVMMPALAHADKVLDALNAEKAKVEKQLKDIGNSKAKPGESLGDEIKRKREETKPLRDKLKEIDGKITKRKEDVKAKKQEKERKDAKRKADLKKFKADKAAMKKQKIKTSCAPCKSMVEQHNKLVELLFDLKQHEIFLKRAKVAMQEQHSEDLEFEGKVSGDKSKFSPGRTKWEAAKALGKSLEIDSKYDALIKKTKDSIKKFEATLAQLRASITECEKQCKKGADGKPLVSLGAGTGMLPMPFDWKGPYTTTCPDCVKLAARLNDLPPMVRDRLARIAALEAWLAAEEAYAESSKVAKELDDDDDDGDDYVFKTPEDRAFEEKYRKEQLDKLNKRKAELAKLKNQVRNLKKYFNQVLDLLINCEKERCKDSSREKAIKVGCVFPGQQQIFVPAGGIGTGTNVGGTELCGYEVEMEYTVSISGSDPFSPEEIERIPDIVNGTDTTIVETPTTPTTTTPTTPTTPVTTDPTTPTTPTTTPLVVTASGVVSFAHIVNTSPCPQAAGTISISSNNGNPLTVSGVSTSGTLSTRLNNTVNGSGGASPSITSQFNCSSADNGSFTGTITGTVTDTVTGETSTFSVNATGTVTGP